MRPRLKYASTSWSSLASDTNIQKLKVMQNTALRTESGWLRDTNIEHLDDETQTLPLTEHSKPHASQIKQKEQHPCHPLHKLTKQNRTLDTKTFEANHFQQHKLHNTPKHSDHDKHFIKQEKNSFSHYQFVIQ